MIYRIQKDDTLRKIAKSHYGNTGLYIKLAGYNGILNPDKINIGQAIEIPTKKELTGKIQIDLPITGLYPPNGLKEIIELFGDIYRYIREDGTIDPGWETDYLGMANLPFAIPLSWDRDKSVKRILCHKKLSGLFSDVFEKIERAGMKKYVQTFGGCYNFRTKRTSGKPSTHCWGIALDLNPDSNQMGSVGDMHPGIVEIFRHFGFKWGGDWPGRSKDPMHFQFCTGY